MHNEVVSLSHYRLAKAREDLSSSLLLLQNGKFAQSINRSYYAIFQATRALLAFDRFDAKKHSSIIAYFSQHYIANKKMDSIYHEILLKAFKIRNKSDYDDYFIASQAEAETQAENAKRYVEYLESLIKQRVLSG